MVKSKSSKKKEPKQESTDIPTSSDLPLPPPADNSSPEKRELYVPANFHSVIIEFVNDLSITFPEYVFLWSKWATPDLPESEIIYLFEYVLSVFPERFFDILYQNDDIFKNESEINTMFLPNVEFKALFNCSGITENTRKTIWKYLQLILFSILNSVGDKSKFGESMNIFEGLDDSILQDKLEETMHNINDFFTNMGKDATSQEPTTETPIKEEFTNESENNEDMGKEQTGGEDTFTFDFEKNLPNPDELHDHLKTLFDGKIGKLAKELAEEISQDIHQFIGEEDAKNIQTSQDVIKTLLKNPQKMMNLVKTVGSKINTKMENGELSQEEIMKEASELFGKMKDMGNTKQFNDLFQNMAKNMGMGTGAKVDTNAMNQRMNNNLLKEKLRKRLQNKKSETTSSDATNTFPSSAFEDIEKLMSDFGLTDDKSVASGSSNSKKQKKANRKR